MSEDCSPKRLPVRVRSTFELATPIKELPPDPDAVALSPETIRRKDKEMDDLLKNAKCEEGTSMDSIATYIPSKATLKRREEEAARAKAAEEAAAREARKAAKIPMFEAQIKNLRRDSFDDTLLEVEGINNLSITRPTTVFADGTSKDPTQNAPLPPRASLTSSDSITVISSPTIGALAAAPPAMGALMGAPPKVGAMVVAALQPAQTASVDCGDTDNLSDDFQIIHDEYKQSLAMEKAAKNKR